VRPRNQERTHLIYQLRVFDAKTDRLIGHMMNITRHGLKLIGERAVRPKREFALRMDLPRNVMRDGHLAFEATSKWCHKDGRGGFYAMGFQFKSISPEGLAVVDTLIRDFFDDENHGNPDMDLNPEL